MVKKISKTKQIKDLKVLLIDTSNKAKLWEDRYDELNTSYQELIKMCKRVDEMKNNMDMVTTETRKSVEREEVQWLREFVTLLTTGTKLKQRFDHDPINSTCDEPFRRR